MKMVNVVLPRNQWVDLYDETGITVGSQINSVNLTANDVRLAATANEPTVTDDHVILAFRAGVAQNDTGDPGAWALCVGGGAIDVEEA